MWEGVKNSAELNMLLGGTIMIRRLKKDVLTQLPPKRRQRITLAPDKLDQRKLKEAMAQLQHQRENPESGVEVAEGVPEHFKLAAECKMSAVADYVEYLFNAG